MSPAHSMPPFYCFSWFSHLPKCSENPALVVPVSLPYTSPFLCSTASPAKGMWSLSKEMAGKPSKGMDGPLLLAEVGGTKEKTPGRMLRCCFMAKYLELLIPISALTWPWLSVTGVVLLESTYYTFPKWRTQSLFQRTTSTDYLCI